MGCSYSNALSLPPVSTPPPHPHPILTETYSLQHPRRLANRRSCWSEGHRHSTFTANQEPVLAAENQPQKEPGTTNLDQAERNTLQSPFLPTAHGAKAVPAEKPLGPEAPRSQSTFHMRGSEKAVISSETSLPRNQSSQDLRLVRSGLVVPISQRHGFRSPKQLGKKRNDDSMTGSVEFFRLTVLI